MKTKKMKKRTLIILSCLVTGNALACDKPKIELELSDKNPVFEKLEFNQDEILKEMKKRGIVTELPGLSKPFVNYGVLAKELKKAGQSKENVVFVVENVKEAFELYTDERLSKRNLTNILDNMGILEKDEVSATGTICM